MERLAAEQPAEQHRDDGIDESVRGDAVCRFHAHQPKKRRIGGERAEDHQIAEGEGGTHGKGVELRIIPREEGERVLRDHHHRAAAEHLHPRGRQEVFVYPGIGRYKGAHHPGERRKQQQQDP
ncbi:hypothetical protein SDC9_101646 [bioreactor metagenome]|uniref:Uncharacterized protein n=1 Tax=bioreactor metagenome TaxID=1076179 RepID=A0A645AVD2_9ZZZZ